MRYVDDMYCGFEQETSKNMEQQYSRKNAALAIHGYAVRFLKHNSSPVLPLQAEAPATPDRISDFGIMEVSWDDHLTEVWTKSLYLVHVFSLFSIVIDHH